MPLFFSRVWAGLLLAGLASYVILKGVLPALTTIDADFPGYFTAAKIVAEGQDAARLYDDVWFREQIHRYGAESPQNPGKFAPFPPPTALLLLPLAGCKPLTALRIVTGVSVLCLLGSILLLSASVRWRLVDSALFVLFSGAAIVSDLRFGQPYILISMFCLLGYQLHREGRPWLAGLCVGLFTPVKYYPVIVLAALALHREWKAVLGGGIAVAGVALLSVGVLGWKVHEIFLLSVFSNHLIGHLSLQDHNIPPFTAVYQSFDTLFNRLFILDPVHNPQPLLVAPQLATLGIIVTKGLLVFLAAIALVKIARRPSANAIAPTIGILGVLVMLIAPATATYTCALLWLPVALLIDYFLATRAFAPAYFILATYAFIGFIPYNHFYPFEGRGGLTVLAYPRLFLLLVLFLGCVYAITSPRYWRSRDPSLASERGADSAQLTQRPT